MHSLGVVADDARTGDKIMLLQGSYCYSISLLQRGLHLLMPAAMFINCTHSPAPLLPPSMPSCPTAGVTKHSQMVLLNHRDHKAQTSGPATTAGEGHHLHPQGSSAVI